MADHRIRGIIAAVVNAALSWEQAAVLAAGLSAGGVVLARVDGSRLQRTSPFLREAGIIAALYALWQLAGSAVVVSADGAVERGRTILRWEQDWHLPSEHTVQDWISPHPWLTQLCNWYYAIMHFGALFAFLFWLFTWHRDQYRTVRTTIVLLTASCLLIQLLPVAPPRLIPGAGFVDTAEQYGQSVYTALAAVGPDQLSAMPSVHVGWAVLIAVVVASVSPSRWRWWVMLHAVLTIFVVTATANHYWADGIVAIVLLALSIAVQQGFRAVAERRRAGADLAPELEPADSAASVAVGD